jgi:hypothetical protein
VAPSANSAVVIASMASAVANYSSEKKGTDTSPLVPRCACVSPHFLLSSLRAKRGNLGFSPCPETRLPRRPLARTSRNDEREACVGSPMGQGKPCRYDVVHVGERLAQPAPRLGVDGPAGEDSPRRAGKTLPYESNTESPRDVCTRLPFAHENQCRSTIRFFPTALSQEKC